MTCWWTPVLVLRGAPRDHLHPGPTGPTSRGRARRRHLLLRGARAPRAGRRTGAAAGRLPLARPLHARPDERREVVRRPGGHRRRPRRRHRVRGRGVPRPLPGGRRRRALLLRLADARDRGGQRDCASSTHRSCPCPRRVGVLGMPGFTAYAGLLELGRPQPGETVVVAAATGPVGSAVGQIAKIQGARAVGIAGGEAKQQLLHRGVRLRRRARPPLPHVHRRAGRSRAGRGGRLLRERGRQGRPRGAQADEPLRPRAGVRAGGRLQRHRDPRRSGPAHRR